MKIKLSFLLLFLVMHSQNALSIDFYLDLDVDPESPCQNSHLLIYHSDTDSVEYEDDCLCCYCFDDAVEQLSDEVFSKIVEDMLATPVTFPGELLPRSTEWYRRMVNTTNGRSIEYSFTVTQSSRNATVGGRFPVSVLVQRYRARFLMLGLSPFFYTITGVEELPEPQNEGAVEETPDENTVEETPDENPVEPTTSNFGNTPDTLPELNPSWWERLTNPFINLLFQQNSR
ncbi:hypothetical protein NX722_14505 [Endozoicomonas gorgoniicola]|uniref:Uncharacterized protein n=1 Tax=Endozoicomonas gorgoniicola TaxID=1234144 RepID=A0ABT3MWS2_9GAMM|nr:hypothetical protein [Endozoicomonas gorgoniicola]MCW7553816.1 hypothetical protein [Endozoicomonas gorgoniicola]